MLLNCEYIYHYTSLETLALILKNRNIKFNSLKNVDDLNESEFSDGKISLSAHTFISCWTKSEDDNLALWNIYTPNMQGVRIKLPRKLFQLYNFIPVNNLYVKENQRISDSLVPENQFFNEKYFILNLKESLIEIEYTNEESLLKPKLYSQHNGKFTFEFGKIGKYKSEIWRFQQEVRFKITVLPTSDLNRNKINPFETDDFLKIINENIPPPIETYFIPILESAFEKMEITLGPKCNLSHEIILQSLIEKYNPKAKYAKNRYDGLIKKC